MKYYVRDDKNPEKDAVSNYFQAQHSDLKIWNNELTKYRDKQLEELEASGGTYNILEVTPLLTNKIDTTIT